MNVLSEMEEAERLEQDRKRLNEFVSKNRKSLRELLEEKYAEFVVELTQKEKDVSIEEIEVTRKFLDYLKHNL